MYHDDNREQVPFELALSEDERRLIDEELNWVVGDLAKRLSLGLVRGNETIVLLSGEDLVELAEHLASALNHATSSEVERRLQRLYARIAAVCDAAANRPYSPPSGIRLERIALAPEMISRLMYEWEGEDAAVRTNPNLALQDVEVSQEFRNARILLRAMAEAGTVKATVAKNLNRAFSTQMLEALEIAPEHRASTRALCKVINEADVWGLWRLRVLCEMARLIALRKGQFRVTKRGQALLDDGRAGELYETLFRVYFRELNWAYLYYRGPSLHERLQPGAGLVLFVLSVCPEVWLGVEGIGEAVLPQPIKRELEDAHYWTPGRAVDSVMLVPLTWFGLVERPTEDPRQDEERRVRTTPLFSKFLSFHP